MVEYHMPLQSSSYDETEDDVLNEHVHDPGDPDGVIAAEKLRQWNEAHPHPQVIREKPERIRRWPIVLAVIAVVTAASVGAYWLGTQHAIKMQAATNQKVKQQAKQKAEAAVPISTQTKHYDSTNFGLGFDYPDNWTVSDTPNKLTVTSAPTSLMTAVGMRTNVNVVAVIQNQQSSITGFPAKGAVASLASDLIKYTHPSTVQRAQTYLSYLSYTGQTDLDMLYLTGDKSYQQGQAVPMSDIAQGNPLISVGFEKGGSGSSDFVTLKADSWRSSPAAQAVNNLFASIVINS